jgi:hypothetical protein
MEPKPDQPVKKIQVKHDHLVMFITSNETDAMEPETTHQMEALSNVLSSNNPGSQESRFFNKKFGQFGPREVVINEPEPLQKQEENRPIQPAVTEPRVIMAM